MEHIEFINSNTHPNSERVKETAILLESEGDGRNFTTLKLKFDNDKFCVYDMIKPNNVDIDYWLRLIEKDDNGYFTADIVTANPDYTYPKEYLEKGTVWKIEWILFK